MGDENGTEKEVVVENNKDNQRNVSSGIIKERFQFFAGNCPNNLNILVAFFNFE